MTCTFKLSRRLARSRMLAIPGLLVLLARCAPGEPKEAGLGPSGLSALAIAPDTATLHPSQTLSFQADGMLSDGSPVNGVTVAWTATGGTITSTGQYTAGNTPGHYLVIASDQGSGLTDTGVVTITNASVVSLTLTPARLTLQTGQSQQFDASATLSDGSVDNTPPVTWSATGGTITTAGLYTAGSTAGSFRVIGTANNGKADTSAVTVSGTAPAVTALSLTPATVTLSAGRSQQFTVSATLSDGSTSSVPVTWRATGGSITTGGRYTAGSTAGTFRVIAAAANGVADTSAVTVTVPTITAITVTPASATVAVTQTRQFSASATLSNGTTQSNPSVTWTATGGTITSGGLFTAGSSTGTFSVAATAANGRADSSTVTVVPPPTLTGIAVSPKTVSVYTAQTQQFTAQGAYSDGSTGAVSVVWAATGGTVTTGGLFTAPATVGTMQVIATLQGGTFADTASVTVTPAPPPGAAHPNEPAGFSKLAYSSFTTTTTEDGWSGSSQAPLPTITTETPGPDAKMETPGSFGRATYPAGFLSGNLPVHFYRDISVNQLYGSFWMRRSSNFVYEQSGVNKLTFVWFGGNPTFFLNDDGGLSFWLQNQASPAGQNNPNLGAPAPVSKGLWHHVEYLISGGNVKVWLDGTKVIDKTVNLGGSTAQKVEWAPYWGGNTGERVPADQYLDVDDYYISGQ